MAKKTTKAQRRAAKLNRRSKDYRRQIAAQARKEEQAKNPTKKKVYRKSKAEPNRREQTYKAYNPLNHVALAVFATVDDYVAADVAIVSRDLVPIELERLIRDVHPEFDGIYVIQMPFGTELELVEEFTMCGGITNFFYVLIEGAAALGDHFTWTSFNEFCENYDALITSHV